MPLNDMKQSTPRLVRAGKIRLGYKAKWCPKCHKPTLVKDGDTCKYCQVSLADVKESPIDSDHFVLDDAPELVKVYGEEPNLINIWFPFNTVEENMPAFHKMRNSPFVTCQGDGSKITYAVDPQTGRTIARDGFALEDFQETDINGKRREFVQGEYVPCPGKAHNLYAKCRFCKPSITLKFLVREIPRMAYFELTTGSIHNYHALDGALSYFTAAPPNGLGLSLKFVPFFLRIGPQQISAPNLDKSGKPKVVNGKPQPRIWIEKQLLTLEIDPEYMAKLSQAQSLLADPLRLLALPGVVPADDDSDGYEEPAEAEHHDQPSMVIEIPPLKPETVAAPAGAVDKAQKTEPASTQNDQADTPKTNGHNRPYAPAELKKQLDKIIAGSTFRDPNTGDGLPAKLHPLGAKTPNLISSLFQTAWPGDPEAGRMYHSCLNWLTGKSSAKDLTAAEADALIYWLVGKENKKLPLVDLFNLAVTQPVIEEAHRVHREALLATGQIDMFGQPAADSSGDDPSIDELFPAEVGNSYDADM